MNISRAELLLRGAAGTGAALAGPLVSRALAQEGGGDAGVLRFALTLERLELALYEHAARLELSPEVRDVAREFGGHQRAFVDALVGALRDAGAAPGPTPRFAFLNAGEPIFLVQAAAVEDLGVAALNGAAPLIESKELLAVAGSIVATEAAHAVTWRMLAGENPTVAAFDERFGRARVLRELGPFVVG